MLIKMKTRFIYCFVLSFLMIAIIPSCSYFGASRYDFTPLDSLIRGWMDKGYYPGGAVCVSMNDSVIFTKCYGDFTPDTKVYVASAGKWVAAAVIA